MAAACRQDPSYLSCLPFSSYSRSLQVFAGHSGSVTCGAFTPDGKSVCTGSADSTLRLWNPRSGECTHTVQGFGYHTAALTCMDMAQNEALVVTGSEDGSSRLVSTATGKVAATLAGHSDSVETVRFCNAMPFVASGSVDGHVVVWDLQVRLLPTPFLPECSARHSSVRRARARGSG